MLVSSIDGLNLNHKVNFTSQLLLAPRSQQTVGHLFHQQEDVEKQARGSHSLQNKK